jgi:hypothetical protein
MAKINTKPLGKLILVYNSSGGLFQEGCLHKLDNEDKSYLYSKICFKPDLIIGHNSFWMITSGSFKDKEILERDCLATKLRSYLEKAERPVLIIPLEESLEQLKQYKSIKESNLVFGLLGVK